MRNDLTDITVILDSSCSMDSCGTDAQAGVQVEDLGVTNLLVCEQNEIQVE